MSLTNTYLPLFFLILVRIMAVLITAPLFGQQQVPAVAKIGLGLSLALVLWPLQAATPVPLADGLLPFAIAVAREFLTGTLIGFTCSLVLATVQMAAGVMGIQIGFRAATAMNPFFSFPASSFEQFYFFLALLFFLGINGHHWVIIGLQRSFEVVPLQGLELGHMGMERLVYLVGNTFVAAVKIALPVLATLLMTDVALGLVARAVPQVQVFFVGIPLKMGLGLAALLVSLPVFVFLLRMLFGQMLADLSWLLQAL